MFDSARWERFEHRPGDIVISTPPKSGTTWTQMLCALMIMDGPTFDAPLDGMSPWLDMRIRTEDEVFAIYDAQTHRRFIKSHTPLDGLPLRDDVNDVVVGRGAGLHRDPGSHLRTQRVNKWAIESPICSRIRSGGRNPWISQTKRRRR